MSRLEEGFSNLSLSSNLTAEARKSLEEQKDRWLSIPQLKKHGFYLPVILPPDDCADRQWQRLAYEALPTETSIRLLRLHPLARKPLMHTDLHQPIICSITTVDLNDKPEYTALSYCWGDPQTVFPFRDLYRPAEQWAAPAFEIYLEDGTPISVGANLYGALLSLRSLVTDELHGLSDHPNGVACPYPYFWIDAICINQLDDDEKSSQVSMMHRVYDQAALVNVWLGGSDPASDIFEAVKVRLIYLFTVFDKTLETFGNLKIDDPSIYDHFKASELNFASVTMGEWMAVYAFFARSWFSRAWVIQELAFAKKAFAICGASLIDIDELVLIQNGLRATQWVSQLRRIIPSFYIDYESSTSDPQLEPTLPSRGVPRLFQPNVHSADGLHNLIEIFEVAFGLGRTRENLWEPGSWKHERLPNCHPFTLLELMKTFTNSGSGNPRDKVYSFLGLCEEFRNGSMSSMPVQIKPNYGATVRQVFTEAAAFCLHTREGFRILETGSGSLHPRSGNRHNLPSWVCDFEHGVGGAAPWSAIGAYVPKFEVDVSGGILHVRASKLGVVDKIFHYDTNVDLASISDFLGFFSSSQEIQIPHWDVHDRLKFKSLRWRLTVDSPKGCIETQTRWGVFWRTCINNTNDPWYPASEEDRSPVIDALEVRILRTLKELQGWYSEEYDKAQADLRKAQSLVPQTNASAGYAWAQNLIIASIIDQMNERIYQTFVPIGEKILRQIYSFRHIIGQSLFNSEQRFSYLRRLEPGIADLIQRIREYDNPRTHIGQVLSFSEEEEKMMVSTIHNQRMNAIPTQTLARTSMDLMGNVPNGTLEGDEIWLFPGLRSPAILRKIGRSMVDRLMGRGSDKDYQFIGTAYVHGAMHGELAEDLKDESFHMISLV